MQQITLRLSKDTLESLEGEANERDVSRSEYIRDMIASRHEADELRQEHIEEVERMRTEHEREVERLENELEHLEARVNELQAQLRAANKRNEEHTELVEYVQEERSITKRRAQAGLWTKTKWALFGMSDTEVEDA